MHAGFRPFAIRVTNAESRLRANACWAIMCYNNHAVTLPPQFPDTLR
jgi:hypothetical protein